MTRTLALVLRVAAVPAGVGTGFGTAQVTPPQNTCPPQGACLLIALHAQPTFATWECVLFGAGAAAVLLLLSLAVAQLPSATARNAFRAAAVAAGVGVGRWTAQLGSFQQCASFARCPSPYGIEFLHAFTALQCAVFGGVAAVLVLLLSVAATRLPSREIAAGSTRALSG
ncbi:MAG TPA: hypothetical protein VI434_07055 [Candidatus Dormibacteraeota bacterium]